ncbi:hypothetical protein [Larkinella soli]|uniref:hypothetical protein n=1 Tax=Larkinella soli TaxID=1770527 RepID=UPI000FFB49BE|nr:hypothetical protein [Larkinella soli]
MKTIANQLLITLLAGVLALTSHAQANPNGTDDSTAADAFFAVGMVPDLKDRINLFVDVYAPKVVSIKLKDERNNVLYEESLSRKESRFWRKFDLKELGPGKYRFIIAAGKQKVIRQVQIAAPPVNEPKRYISYIR